MSEIAQLSPKTVELTFSTGESIHLSPITVKTLIRLEERFDVTLETLGKFLEESFKKTSVLVEFLAILADPSHPGITSDEIAGMMPLSDMTTIVPKALNRVVTRSFPQEKKGGDGKAPLGKKGKKETEE